MFLFAKRVENAGSISTPGGQTCWPAAVPGLSEEPRAVEPKLYASESNPDVPVLRGLLVEVGNGPTWPPRGCPRQRRPMLATGTISTARGNTTLVGMAVNQSGRVSATTSVTENGSIILRAQGGARQGNNVSGTGHRVRRDLVLGSGSHDHRSRRTTEARTSNGGVAVKTSDGNATFVNPRIDLAGQTRAARPGRAGAWRRAPSSSCAPRVTAHRYYETAGLGNYLASGDSSARVVMAEGGVIDVSGTTGTPRSSVSRYFVTTELLGSNDLKDAPLQKDGLLFRSQATLDVRDDSARSWARLTELPQHPAAVHQRAPVGRRQVSA